MSVYDVVFRAALESDDARYPVRLEVSVDKGESWHEVPTRALSVHEHVDDVPTANAEVYLLGHQPRYTGAPIPLKTYEMGHGSTSSTAA